MPMTVAAILVFVVTHAIIFVSGWQSHKNSLGLDSNTLSALKNAIAHSQVLQGHGWLQRLAQIGGSLLDALPAPSSWPYPAVTPPPVPPATQAPTVPPTHP